MYIRNNPKLPTVKWLIRGFLGLFRPDIESAKNPFLKAAINFQNLWSFVKVYLNSLQKKAFCLFLFLCQNSKNNFSLFLKFCKITSLCKASECVSNPPTSQTLNWKLFLEIHYFLLFTFGSQTRQNFYTIWSRFKI